MRQFDSLTIPTERGLSFGVSPVPVRCGHGLEIGAGQVSSYGLA